MSLKQAMAEFGFESGESYDYAINCFLNNPTQNIRYLYIDGEPGRRKTAFAHALAQAMAYPHILYYEFGRDPLQPRQVRIVEGEELAEEPPTEPFDKIMTEACAQSEAESTIVIIDQLHKAEFRQHLRLYEFCKSKVWSYSDVNFYANPVNLLVFLLSDEPVYHSLQQVSFRVWVNPVNTGNELPTTAGLGIETSNEAWLKPLNQLFDQIGLIPSASEYKRLAYDIEQHVRCVEELITSIYGWVEHADRQLLESPRLRQDLEKVITGLESTLTIHESIELSSS